MIATDLAPRIARLLPRLASEHDGEVVATARAIGRTLKSAGNDWHDLAQQIECQPEAALPPPRREKRERASRTPPIAAETLRLLRAALRLEILTRWETDFTASILEAAERPGWRPSRKQFEILARLTGKAQEAEAHP